MKLNNQPVYAALIFFIGIYQKIPILPYTIGRFGFLLR